MQTRIWWRDSGLPGLIQGHLSCLMDFANQYREGTSRYWHPGMSVGTGGGVEWMWGPCACPPRADVILRFTAFLTKRIATWDKHKAPTHPHIHQRGKRQRAAFTPGGTSTRPPPILTSTPCPYRIPGPLAALSYRN